MPETLHIPATCPAVPVPSAWVYHLLGSTEAPRIFPNEYVMTADDTWCISHKPQRECTCGQYTLDWE